MDYSQYNIGDTVEFDGTEYTLLEDRVAKGKGKKRLLTIITVLSVVTMIALYVLQSILITLLGLNTCLILNIKRLLLMFGIFAVSFFLFIIVHEWLHYLTYRYAGGAPKDKLKFGVVLKQGMAYCISLVPMTVKSSRLSLMMPIYVMIIPLFIISVLLGSQPLAILTAAFFSGSAGDIWYMWSLRKTDKDLYIIEEEPKEGNYELGYYVFQKQ